MRENGVAVHCNTVTCALTALLIQHGKQDLLTSKKYKFEKAWAYLWLRRHNYVDRASTKLTQKKVSNVELVYIRYFFDD